MNISHYLHLSTFSGNIPLSHNLRIRVRNGTSSLRPAILLQLALAPWCFKEMALMYKMHAMLCILLVAFQILPHVTLKHITRQVIQLRVLHACIFAIREQKY